MKAYLPSIASPSMAMNLRGVVRRGIRESFALLRLCRTEHVKPCAALSLVALMLGVADTREVLSRVLRALHLPKVERFFRPFSSLSIWSYVMAVSPSPTALSEAGL